MITTIFRTSNLPN